MLRIGIDARVLTTDAPRGIGKYFIEVLSYIRKDRENSYILYAPRELKTTIDLPGNMTVKVIPGKIGTLWLKYRMPRVLEEDRIDVFWGPAHFLPGKRGKTRYLLTVHDLGPMLYPRWYSIENVVFFRLFLKSSVRQADRILADSESTKRGLMEKCSVPESKIQCVYCGGAAEHSADAESMTRAQLQERFGLNGRYFLFIGEMRANTNKNTETIIRAFECLAREEDDVYLALAGKIAPDDPLVQAAQKSPFRDRIKWTGYITDGEKNALYRHASAFVFPSRYEGFGIPVLEAFAHGCPVISASNSSLPEVGGDAAVYLKKETDSEELAARMREMLTMSEDKRQEIIRKGYEQNRKFSWEKCGEETLLALRTLDSAERQ